MATTTCRSKSMTLPPLDTIPPGRTQLTATSFSASYAGTLEEVTGGGGETGSDTNTRQVQRSHMACSLFHAVQNTRFNRVKVLLDQGLRARSVRNDAGENLLMVCMGVGEDVRRERMFSYLIRRGADPGYVHLDTGRDVLTWAVCQARPVQVRQLLDLTGGDLNLLHTDKRDLTALHYATINGDLESVKAITEALQKYHLSVDVCDAQGLTPYIHAMRLGHYDIADYLVRDGFASPRQADKHTFRDAHAWAEEGRRERRRLSREQGKKETIQRKISGRLPQTMKPRLPHIRIDSDGIIMEDMYLGGGVAGTAAGQRDFIEKHGDMTDLGQSGKFGQMGDQHRMLRLPGNTNTALNLIGDSANLAKGSHVFEFKSSELDTNKQDKVGSVGINVTLFMDSLSAQNTSAFRKTAAVPPNYKKVIPVQPEKVKKKEKVSTLAILMGKGPAPSKRKKEKKSKKKPTMDKKKTKKSLLPPI